jgi:hypothetical protein
MPESLKGKNLPDIGSPEWLERYSRQTLLSGVGVDGQKKWAAAAVRVAGEGEALDACLTALASSGLGTLQILSSQSFNAKAFAQVHPQTKIEALPDINTHSTAGLTVVVTAQADLRRRLSRQLRSQGKTGVFAWAAASGFALWVGLHSGKKCPCLECFEVQNPKAFAQGSPVIQRLLGQAAASEALLFLLKGESPLANKVWITSLEAGVSLHHEVVPSYKCPAQLEDEGATVTP